MVFQRLPHHFQNGATEFRQFIQAERLAPLPLNLSVQEIVAVDVFHQVIAYLVL